MIFSSVLTRKLNPIYIRISVTDLVMRGKNAPHMHKLPKITIFRSLYA